MATAVKGSRPYDSTRRKEQARRNRWNVLQHATRLFLEKGYAATTMGEIAAAADVSVESVYKMFTKKAGLLKVALDVSIAGDDEPVAIRDRESTHRVIAEPDPARKIEMFCEQYAKRVSRSGPVTLMIRDAAGADPAAADVWRWTRRGFLEGMGEFADNLHATGRMRRGLKPGETRDVLWTVLSVEMYELLVRERKWSLKRYGSFVSETLKHALLP